MAAVSAREVRDLKVTKQEEAAYYKAARSWDEDRVASALRSRRTAWWVAGFAAAIAGVMAIALAGLMPLKRVDTRLVRVDSSTGIVDNVVQLREAGLGKDEVMNKFFLRRYVTLRESYTRHQLQPNYDQLYLLTAPKLRTALRNEWQMQSATSPYNRFGEHGTAEVKIKNVSLIGPNIGQVRYYVIERRQGVETLRHMVATMEFMYVASPASEDARAVNPLGFLVTSWRTDPEAVVVEEGKVS